MHRPRLLGCSVYLLPPLTALLLAGLAAWVGRPRTVSELLAWLGGSYLNVGLLSLLEWLTATRDPDRTRHLRRATGRSARHGLLPEAPMPDEPHPEPQRVSDDDQAAEFTVTWAIEVTAVGPVDAAVLARSMQCDPETTATVYEVQQTDPPQLSRWEVNLRDPAQPTIQPQTAVPHEPHAQGELGRQLSDHAALEAIAHLLRDPDRASEMLNDIAKLVIRTGRPLDNPAVPPTWNRR